MAVEKSMESMVSDGIAIPTGYTPLDYIEFNGTQYIDTGIYCTQDTTIEAEFVRTDSSAFYLYGAGSDDNTASVTAYLSSGAGNWRFGDTYSSQTIKTGTQYSMVVDKTAVVRNGTSCKYNGIVGTFTTPVTLVLGCNHNQNGSFGSTRFVGKVYGFRMYSDETLVINFVPCLNTTGVAGMYDTVSGNFYSSASDVPFGPSAYQIRFLDWDDTVIASRWLLEDELIDLPDDPIRPDDADYRYTFTGWEPIVPATALTDGDYRATYTATPCYLIQFVDWDGTVISGQRYLQNTVITVPENPTRDSDGVYDYEFDKWTPDVFNVAIAHATYTATYKSTLLPVFYDIIFKDWDGRIISSANYAAGDTIRIPTDPTRENDATYSYVFNRWTPEVSPIASANVTYTAHYLAIELPVYYDIVFVDWNGYIISRTSVLKNSTVVVPSDPVRESDGSYEYTFAGWEPEVQMTATASAVYRAIYSSVKIPKVYNDVSEIFASTSEFEIIRNNSKNDDGTDTVVGVDWFTYGILPCTTIYVSGNSWFGLGSSMEHFKINRRDSAVYSIYREEGMLYMHYKFLRIRFSGYSYYSSTSSSYKITYDVILWDTGDISLHMVDIPTSSYDGTFSLGTLTYTKPTVSKPDVTFLRQSDGTYVVSYEPISFEFPFDRKYLVKIYGDNGYTLHTIIDGALSALDTTTINAETFRQFGSDVLPSGDLLIDYPNFEVLGWSDSAYYRPNLTVDVTATPYPQTVESRDYNMSHPSIFGIEKVLVEATENVSFAMSFDEGASWKAFKDGVWVELTETESGMSAETIRLITTEQWNSAITNGKYRFRMTLVDETSVFTSLVVDYLNEAE